MKSHELPVARNTKEKAKTGYNGKPGGVKQRKNRKRERGKEGRQNGKREQRER